MGKLFTVIEEKLMPIAMKISGQRHMRAIRTGIISTLPLTVLLDHSL